MVGEIDIHSIKKYEKWIFRKKYRNNSFYGRGKILRKLLKLPSYFPIIPHMQHGVNMNTLDVRVKQIESYRGQYVLVFSKYDLELLKESVSKTLFSFPDTFPLYRKLLLPLRKESATFQEKKGTLYFPAHSTRSVDCENNQRKIIEALKDLPEKFKPISISLYWKDVLQGRHIAYMKEGFRVITSGHIFDQNFYVNFYNNLLTYSYTAGNKVGSHSFYSVEAGIPYFLYGPPPTTVSTSEVHEIYGKGKHSYNSYFLGKEYQEINEIFTFPDLDSVEISDGTLEWVGKKLGCFDEYNFEKTRAIIQELYFKNPLKAHSDLLIDVKEKIKYTVRAKR